MSPSDECEICGGNLGHPANGDWLCAKCAERFRLRMLILPRMGRNRWHCEALALGAAPIEPRSGMAASIQIKKGGVAGFWAIIDPAPNHFRAQRRKPGFGIVASGSLDKPLPCCPGGQLAKLAIDIGLAA